MGPARTRGHIRRRGWGRAGRVCRMGGRGARRAILHRGSRTGACRGRGTRKRCRSRCCGAGAMGGVVAGGGGWGGAGDRPPGRPTGGVRGRRDPEAVPIQVVGGWGEGAWGTVAGWVSAPPGALGARTLQVQDETGGVTVYL